MTSGLELEQHESNHSNRNMRATWSNFRERMKLIHNRLNEHRPTYGGRALLIGAGNGYDLPLRNLETNYDSIVVLDIDPSSFEVLIKQVRYPEKFSFVHADVSGIASQIPDLANMNEKELIKMINRLNYTDEWSQKINSQPFDFIMTCHLTTQLVSPFFMMVMIKRNHEISLSYNKAVNLLSNRVIEGLFKSISLLLSKDGLFLHSTDTFEVSHDEITNTWRKGAMEILAASKFDINYCHEVPFEFYQKLMLKGYNITGSFLPRNVNQLFRKLPYNYITPWQFTSTGDFLKTYVVISYPFYIKPASGKRK